MDERIQKILSQCGVASRRKAEEMISEGLVTVNGKTASLGMKADISRDHIKVKGKLIRDSASKVYLMLHKPDRFITSMVDPEGRPTVKDLLRGVKARVFPVGRLDYSSEGLLILTNDGALAHALMHPRSNIPKAYYVKINGFLEDREILKLEKGMRLQDGVTAPAKVKKIRKTGANSWIEITIYEGRNRQVRRMIEKLGHSVLKLKRIRINGIILGTLPSGKYRHLTSSEVRRLKQEVSLNEVHSR